MTAAEGRRPFGFELPVHVSIGADEVTSLTALQDVARPMSTDIKMLNKHLLLERIQCATVVGIAVKEGQLHVSFQIENKEQLNAFEKLSKDGQLSKSFTVYSENNWLAQEAGLGFNTILRFHLEMDEVTFLSGEHFFQRMGNRPPDGKQQTDDDKMGTFPDGLGKEKVQTELTLSMGQFLKKEVVFVMPRLEYKRFNTVTLHIGDEKNEMKSSKSTCLCRCVLEIPVDKVVDNITYKLEADITVFKRFTRGLIRHSETHESRPYHLTEAAVQRIFWNTFNPMASELADHYKDIVINCSVDVHLAELCMQIENFSKTKRLEIQEAVEIYNIILKSLDKNSAKHWLLLLVIVSNIFRSTDTAAHKIEICEINSILKTINHFQLCQLTSDSAKYLPAFLKALCKKAQGDHFCFIMFVRATYPFLSEEVLLHELSNVLRERASLVVGAVEKETFQVLGNIFDNAKSESAQQFLEKLLLNCPVKLALEAYAFLKQREGPSFTDSTISKSMLENVLLAVKSFAKSSQRTVAELEEVWDIAESTDTEIEILVPEFENAIIRTVGKKDNKDLEKIKYLLLQSKLFESEIQQLEMFDCLAKTRNTDLHFLLFKILHNTKFHEAAKKASQKWFCLCLENGIVELKKRATTGEKLKGVYEYFAKANEVPVIRDSESLQETMTSAAVDFLRLLDLGMLMRSTRVVEEVAATSPSVLELFRHHVKTLLESQHRNNFYELLSSLCGTHGQIRVNSRLTYEIVCTVLDIAAIDENLPIIEGFRELLKQFELWMAVSKASGSYQQDVKLSQSNRVACSYVKRMLDLIMSGDIQNGVLKDLSKLKNKTDILNIFSLVTSDSQSNIRSRWESIENCFKNEHSKLKHTSSVLREVQIHMANKYMPTDIGSIMDKLNKMSKSIEYGQHTARNLENIDSFWDDLSKLPEMCSFLCNYVKSKIFWTSSKEVVEDLFEKERLKQSFPTNVNDTNENSIAGLFEEELETADENHVCNETFLLLTILTNKGITSYKDAWVSLIREHNQGVRFALKLLQGICLEDEIKIAEQVLHEPVPPDIEKTLNHLMNITKYEHIVDCVKKSLIVFKVKLEESDSLNSAINAFESIRDCKGEDCPFPLVIDSLRHVDAMSKTMSSETLDIMNALSQSSLVVEFLWDIIEEDIRNLIDAVDCISEQQVQASTVSALIDIKSFLHGILIKASKGLSASDFIASLNKQTNSLSENASKLLPSKIYDCRSSLHSLKSLYGNVANRGAMTVEIINSITIKGKFIFNLNEGYCCFHATCKHGKQTEDHSKPSLMDLRSRALLLMNTRSQNKKINSDTLDRFVNYIDMSIEIAELISELHQSGNIQFMKYESVVGCRGLIQRKEELMLKSTQWAEMLQKVREKYYLLNFIHGPEIHTLYRFFEANVGREKVVTTLRFIHPEIEIEQLMAEYQQIKLSECTWSDEQLINCIGRILHLGYEGKKPLQRPCHLEAQAKRITDIVQNRKLFVAALEESSTHVVKTILALYLNTTHFLPEPHQVLFCTKDTTWNELELLLYRCFGSSRFTGISQLFCIANTENLVNELQFRLVETLKNINTNEKYLLALICRGSSAHPFLDELSSFKGKACVNLSDDEVRQAFQNECPKVETITSAVPGLGKTNRIKEYAFSAYKYLFTLHISGPLNKRRIIDKLTSANIGKQHALHLDIGTVDDPVQLDTFIFELIILRYVTAGLSAVSLETGHVFIEVGNTINDSLRNSLDTAMCFKRKHLTWKNYDDFYVSSEINSPVQVVCHYLLGVETGTLDKSDIVFTGNNAVTCLKADVCRRLLRTHFGTESDLSFAVVNIFLQVLADQLKKMSCSAFFRVSHILDMVGPETLSTVRSTLATALIKASKEFSSRSIAACRSAQVVTAGTPAGEVEEQMLKKQKNLKHLESVNKRVDGMIRWEDSNHLIFVFHNQNIQTLSPLYLDLNLVPKYIRALFESQLKRTMQDFSQMDQNQLQTLLQKVARTNPQSLSHEKLNLLRVNYALTPDNLLKMVLIMLRIKSQIPVVIMGETGCGKTSLVRYLAAVSDVEFEVLSIHAGTEESDILSIIGKNNTEALSNPVQEKWLFLDEINTSEHIGLIGSAICSRTCHDKVLAPNLVIMGACNPYKLRSETAVSTAGLTEKVKTDDLSKLVYRVLPLPERMVDYVWDFGSLSDNDEAVYIERMVGDIFHSQRSFQGLLLKLLSESQKFVRRTEDASYGVSLRDIQRCITLIKWFLYFLPQKDGLKKYELRSVILALSICYHSRFSLNSQRTLYRQTLEHVFSVANCCSITENEIHDIIIREQKDILNRMELPPGTAKNTALHENVFVILICLLNRIPVFLVGKPGCSKSLSMQIIRSSLRGKDSKDLFFQKLPQLYCVSFQGSESSTSDGIIKVFEKAEQYQKSNENEEVLSVVILDEIGLAEISRFNPLKVLHSLLEPDGLPQPKVAVVGISNWALDASKMNRAIHLSRPDMDEEELYQTGVSISESFLETKQHIATWFSDQETCTVADIKPVLRDIAKSYLDYVGKLRFKNFHGLRDYYSLVKFVSKKLIEEYDAKLSVSESVKQSILLEGLQRNFGGRPSEEKCLLESFKIKLNSEGHGTASILKLMKDNIEDKMARHLMCITSGESVLSLFENLLKDINREEKEVIFGSHFEEDQTPDYDYRILSRIILCMEQGLILILKDLENVYGSLYDMLNQNYTIIGKKKHCRIALGHYSNPLCQVHDDFRCVVLVDEGKVDFSDPPFLNRFEKQYLNFRAVMSSEQHAFTETIETYVERFCRVESYGFRVQDCFPLYSQDLIPSLVMAISQTCQGSYGIQTQQMSEKCMAKLLQVVQPDAILRLQDNVYEDICRNAEQVKQQFFKFPLHSGIWNFIEMQLEDSQEKCLMTVVLTNSYIHSKNIHRHQKYQVQVEKLGAFKSEKQLSLRLQHFWIDSPAGILLLHSSVIEDETHISLAKATIEKTRISALKENSCLQKHVYLILHLDRRQADTDLFPVNFLSGWEIVLLDTLEEPEIPLPHLCKMSLYETVLKKKPLTKYIIEQLFWCFSTIHYERFGRNIESIHGVIEQMKKSDDFLKILEELICECVISEFDTLNELKWQQRIALDGYALNISSAYMAALEEAVLCTVRQPLSKIIYELENINALSAYFCDQHDNQRLEIWKTMVRDRSLFSVMGTPSPSGPECYFCTAYDLTLRMPLSKILYEKVEETKDEFMESFLFVKGKCDITENEKMPEQVMEELFSQHERMVKDMLPDLTGFMYDSVIDDYFHDFSNFVSYTLTSRLREDLRIKIVQRTLSHSICLHSDNLEELLVKLHATVWIFSSVLSAEFQLFETCAEVFNVEENFAELLDTLHIGLHHDKGLELPSGPFSSTKSSRVGEDWIVNEAKKLTVNHSLCAEGSLVNNGNTILDEENTDINAYKETADVRVDMMTTHLPSLSDNCVVEELQSAGLLSADDSDIIHHFDKELPPDVSVSDRVSSSTPSEDGSVEEQDYRILLVEFVSLKMIPTESCLSLFKSVSDWNSRVSIILSNALLVSSEPPVLHCLRFFLDLMNILQPNAEDPNMAIIYKLASLLQSDSKQSLDSDEAFVYICELLFNDPRPTGHETQCIIAAYLNRCLACNADTQSLISVMHLIEEKKLVLADYVALKPPLHLAINLEVEGSEDDAENIYEILIQEGEVSLEEHPFLALLDKTLSSFQGTVDMDSQLAVLVVDIFEEYFENLLKERPETDYNKSSSEMLSAHKLILEGEYGLQFIVAVSYFKAFMKSFREMLLEKKFNIMECAIFLPEIRAVMSQKEGSNFGLSTCNFVIKSVCQSLLPWNFYKKCENIHEKLNYFQCPDWTEGYLTTSVEGNPLFQHDPLTFRRIENALSEKDTKNLEAIIKEMLTKPHEGQGTLMIQAVALSLFYISRSYSRQVDTANQIAEKMIKTASSMVMDEANFILLACLLGTKTFPCSELNLKEESGEVECCIAFFCCSLFAVILASNQKSVGNELPFLATCLLSPSNLRGSVIHSLKTLTYKQKSRFSLNGEFIWLCSCGHRVIQRQVEYHEKFRCPVCKEEVHETFENSKTQLKNDEVKSETFGDRTIAPVTAKLIFIFVYSCLFGSLALKRSTENELRSVIGISEVDDIPSWLMKDIGDTFSDLQNTMNMDCRELYIFLHACLLKVKNIIAQDKSSVNTKCQMLKWCLKFENGIKDLCSQRFETVAKMVGEQFKHTDIAITASELCVNENDAIPLDTETRTHLLPSLFRIQGQPSLSSLMYEIDMLGKDSSGEGFPFLSFVLGSLSELAVTENLVPIVHWHLATVTHIGFRFKKQECLEMTVQDFIYRDDSENVRSILKARFDKLQRSLSHLEEAQNQLKTPARSINDGMKMKDCLLLNSQSVLYKLVKELAEIHNKFLDTALLISVRSNCQALKCLSRGENFSALSSRSVVEANSSNVVGYHWDEELLKFSHADLTYGCGKYIRYEFAAIEKSLALDLVIGKCFLRLDNSFPSVVFIDEFYQGFSKLVREVISTVPQKELPLDTVNGIKAKRDRHPRLTTDLMTHTGVLLTLLKKTKGDPDQSVREYVDHWKSYLTHPFPLDLLPASQDTVKICHLVALYGVLEELNADCVIESLCDEYRSSLHRDSEIQIKELLNDKKKEAETILKVAKRFTYRCLSVGEVTCSRSLSECIEDDSFWPLKFHGMEEENPVKKNILQLLPNDLKVGHLYQMISLMEQKLKESTAKEVQLTHIASFKPTTVATKAERRKKMATKRRV